jgi:hypothetical protein
MTGAKKSNLKRSFVQSVLVMISLAFLASIGWFWLNHTGLVGENFDVRRIAPYTSTIRILFFISLIVFYPRVITFLAKWKHWTQDEKNHALASRVRVAAWLFILELVIGQNIVAKFFDAVGW